MNHTDSAAITIIAVRSPEIPEAIDKLRRGGVIGRFIAEYRD